jgi:ATPase subunit of ABC transporter with duplicated ATPase domains
MDALAARLGAEPDLAEAYSEALERFLALGGGDLEARAGAACAQAGLAVPLDRPLGAVSGGQAARARLAALLLARVDVLCLDEPTNDLDFAGLALLERFVRSTRATVVVVSHDRAFLEATVDRVVELEPETRRVREYAGGFAAYERLRAAAHASERSAWEQYVDERDRFSSLLSERRGEARAGGKQANRRGTHALSTKVRQAERRLERLDRPETPWRPWELRLELPEAPGGGDLVVSLEGAVVARGGFRLGPVDLELRRGERVAVAGPNGSGKTTLLEALLGELPLAAGRRRLGPGARIGRVDQSRARFDVDEPLLARVDRPDARSLLGRFGLRGDAVLRPARSLSPGERTRALVALLAAAETNALVLDEPTNHLDLEAIGQLEQALAAFTGAVLLVTHDRRLLEAFAPDRTVALGT